MSLIHAMAPHLPAALAGPAGNAAADKAAADRAAGGLQGASKGNAAEKAAETKETAGTAPRHGGPHAPLRADRDEYCPGEPPQPSGRYWLGQDAEGRRIVRVDGQAPSSAGPVEDSVAKPEEKAAPAKGNKAEPEKEAAPAKEAPRPAEQERCTVNTDKVDREIKQLKEEKARLEQQLQQGPPPQKEEQLNQKLQQVEEQLRQKDNDAYRRQHAEYSLT